MDASDTGDVLAKDDLENPEFIRWLEAAKGPGPIVPEDCDFTSIARPLTIVEQAHDYQLAQSRKLVRLYREWRSGHRQEGDLRECTWYTPPGMPPGGTT